MKKTANVGGSSLDVSAFFPAYNEEGNIEKVINDANRVLKEIARRYEIIVVVYEGSKDRTIDIVKGIAKKNKKVRLLIQPLGSRGTGYAIKMGLENSKYKYVFYSDSDNQFNQKELKKIVPSLKYYDIVAGYRINRKDPFLRILTAKIYNILLNILFKTRFRDVDCAFRILKKDILKKINLNCKTGLGTFELLVKAKRRKFKIKFIGVNHYPRTKGKPLFESTIIPNLHLPQTNIVIGLLKEMVKLKKELKKGNSM